MKYLSVCSGIEAATVAWHPLEWEPAAFCEIEAFPSAVLAHHYQKVPNYGDFTRLSEPGHAIRSAGIDLLVGGTPCQAFSVAGLRKGLADPRGGLTLEFCRLAQALRPRWIVWENVPGVLSQDGGRAFGAFLWALVYLGYGFAYRVLDAQWFGVAQRRRRVFVVACAGGRADRAAAVLFEPEGVYGDPPSRRAQGQDAAADASGGTASGGGHVEVPDVVGTLSDGAHNGGGSTAKTHTQGASFPSVAMCLNAGSMGRRDAETETLLPVGGSFDGARVVPYDLCQITAPINRQNRDTTSPCHTLARDNAAHTAVVEAFDARQSDVLLYGDKSGPLDTDGHSIGVCVTGDWTHALRAEGADASEDGTGRGTPIVTTPMSVRRLTPRECERLQGFPDDYTRIPWKKKPASECPDGPRYKALGNSMAVPVMRWIGERIKRVDAL